MITIEELNKIFQDCFAERGIYTLDYYKLKHIYAAVGDDGKDLVELVNDLKWRILELQDKKKYENLRKKGRSKTIDEKTEKVER